MKGKKTEEKMLTRILNVELAIILKRFETGNSRSLVLHTRTYDFKDMVLKIGFNNRSSQEITNNIIGYDKIRSEGLEELLPEIILPREIDGIPYLITNFLGDNFAEKCRKEPNPARLYQKLCDALYPIYLRTLKEDNKGIEFLRKMQELLIKNYEEYLFPINLISRQNAIECLNLNEIETMPKHSCFAVFDFTPEDVYLNDKFVKYPDPKPDIRGVPIIDLACFAGVSKDVYDLPGSQEGYAMIKKFALENVAKILEVDYRQAERIFNFGRSIQMALSSRFRIQTEPRKAQKYALSSLEYLKKASM